MFNKVKALTKIFIKDFYQNTNLVNKETKKLNKKSLYFWILVLLLGVLIYISYKGINFFELRGAPEIFIKIYMMFLIIFLMFQITIICTNIFFFSKDLEFILPLPIKSKELLIAKFITLLVITYFVEIIFGIPLILYGFLNYTTFIYFINLIILLILLPIIFTTIISFLSIILMKLFGFIKNKTVLQNIISFILVMILLVIENKMIGTVEEVEKSNYFFKMVVDILIKQDILENFKNIFILLILDIVTFVLLIQICQKFYLKMILKNLTSNKRKLKLLERRPINIQKRRKNIWKEYVKKEFKMLFKQPIFFMQTVFPVIMILISIIMIANFIIPAIDTALENNESTKNAISSLEFNTEMICAILGFLQVIFSLSSLSLTAISREGKSAIFMKYIPISYYKQFLYKNVLQVLLNIIVSIVVLSILYFYIPKIGLINIILIFVISIFINLITSYITLVVDLKRPNLNWNSEHSVVKKNDNKSFQYALTFFMVLVYLYLSNILKGVNVTVALVIEIFIFMMLFIIIDRIIKKKSTKLFEKIN